MGCAETWLSGRGLARLHRFRTGREAEPPDLAARAAAGDPEAAGTLAHFADLVGRGLALLVNVLDPDAIVLGGGLSGLPGLVEGAQAAWGRWALAERPRTRLAVARHGAESGMRGAAWL